MGIHAPDGCFTIMQDREYYSSISPGKNAVSPLAPTHCKAGHWHSHLLEVDLPLP